MTFPPIRSVAYFFSAMVHASVAGTVLLVPGSQPARIAEVAGIEVELVTQLPGGLLENATKDPIDSAQAEMGEAVTETQPEPREPRVEMAERVSLPPPPREKPDFSQGLTKMPPPSPPVEESDANATSPVAVQVAKLSPVAGAKASDAAAKTAEIGPSLMPRLLANPKPLYPKRARKGGVEGQVLLRVQIGTDGKSKAIETLRTSGHHLLDAAAVKAVRKWHFSPALRNGTPVVATLDIPITFRIKN
ncbi:MAG: hypothetical protein COA65_08480 [Rhodospirillaceae bacterium]|nr:MAG: hypothetical protein COA65_08480 [Rhodospirillaceae bacterium]